MDLKEHLLTCLAEESAEVGQDVCKSLRFGLDDRNVLNPTGPTNRERLIVELNQFLAVVEMLVDAGALPANWVDAKVVEAKKHKVAEFMGYAARHGTLDYSKMPMELLQPKPAPPFKCLYCIGTKTHEPDCPVLQRNASCLRATAPYGYGPLGIVLSSPADAPKTCDGFTRCQECGDYYDAQSHSKTDKHLHSEARAAASLAEKNKHDWKCQVCGMDHKEHRRDCPHFSEAMRYEDRERTT